MAQLDHPPCPGHPVPKWQCQDSGLELTRKRPEGSLSQPPGDSQSPVFSQLFCSFTTLPPTRNYIIIHLSVCVYCLSPQLGCQHFAHQGILKARLALSEGPATVCCSVSWASKPHVQATLFHASPAHSSPGPALPSVPRARQREHTETPSHVVLATPGPPVVPAPLPSAACRRPRPCACSLRRAGCPGCPGISVTTRNL